MLDRATKVEEIVRHSVGHTYIYIYMCVWVFDKICHKDLLWSFPLEAHGWMWICFENVMCVSGSVRELGTD